jgi:hypothetical protein
MGLKAFHSRREIGRSVVVGVAAAGLVGTALAGAVMAPAGAVAVAAGVSSRVATDDTVLGTFEALGAGVNDLVKALAVSGDDTLYAGGQFTPHPAAWSTVTRTWSALGTGLNNEVLALALEGDDTVYAGGKFDQSGGVPGTGGIAAWSTVIRTWSALGTGVDFWVLALALHGDDTVYAGGFFNAASGKSGTENIAAWSNADDTWHALGTGVNSWVYALAASADDTVYAGGAFTSAGGKAGAKRVAAWSNADDTWHALGGGMDATVMALAVSGDDTLYAGGSFTDAGGKPGADGVAAWSYADDTWHALDTGVGGSIKALAVDDTRGLVYAGGDFTTAGDDSASGVAVWDAGLGAGLGEWIALQAAGGEGVSDPVGSLNVLALALDDSVLYLGGDFLTAGGVAASRIARWTWDAPSVVAVPASGAAGASVVLEGSGLIGVTGVSVDDTPVAYTRDDSTTISLTLPVGLSAGCHAITVDAVGGQARTSYAVPVPPSPPAPPCPWGPPSPPTPPSPPNPVVYPPGAPTSALAVAGDASASVSWVAPTSAGSFPVTDYEVASAPTGGSCLVKAPAVSCTVLGLANGTSYTFTVRALNGAGWGARSGPSNAVTPSPSVVKTIQITGSRDASDTRMVRVSGTTTDLVGEQVTPWVRFPGQTTFTAGTGVRTVAADGTFAWSRATGKKVHVYFTHGSVKSNTVVIPAR